jgi:hypothetical protein
MKENFSINPNKHNKVTALKAMLIYSICSAIAGALIYVTGHLVLDLHSGSGTVIIGFIEFFLNIFFITLIGLIPASIFAILIGLYVYLRGNLQIWVSVLMATVPLLLTYIYWNSSLSMFVPDWLMLDLNLFMFHKQLPLFTVVYLGAAVCAWYAVKRYALSNS